MNEIQIFNNPQFGEIRIVANENDEPMFCVADVARVLDLIPSKIAQRLSEDVLSKYPLETAGGTQMANFMNEDGLYDAIFESRKPEAKKFRKWVTSEVLPSIRKHGGYMVAKENETTEELMARALMVAQETLKRREQRLLEAEKKIQEDAPKVEFHDQIVASVDTCLVRELAKVLTQNGYTIGQNRLYEILRKEGYLSSCRADWNQPTQRYMEQKIFEVDRKPWTNPKTGEQHIGNVSKVTPKGIKYFLKKFLGK